MLHCDGDLYHHASSTNTGIKFSEITFCFLTQRINTLYRIAICYVVVFCRILQCPVAASKIHVFSDIVRTANIYYFQISNLEGITTFLIQLTEICRKCTNTMYLVGTNQTFTHVKQVLVFYKNILVKN